MNKILDRYAVRMVVQVMACSYCGSEADATCTCGEMYVPKAARAAEAVSAHPEKSDRALAAEIGVARSTIQRARQSGGPCGPPDQEAVAQERRGRDNKAYRVRTRSRQRAIERNPASVVREQIRRLFLDLAYEDRGLVLDDLDRIYQDEGADRQ